MGARPARLAVVGPISEAVGTHTTLVGAALLSLAATLTVLLVRDVRELGRLDGIAPVEPATEVAT